MITIPDGVRRPAEAEREELRKQLAEARAEIEWLEKELRDNSMLAARQIVPAEMLVDDLTAEVERKDKMIEVHLRKLGKKGETNE